MGEGICKKNISFCETERFVYFFRNTSFCGLYISVKKVGNILVPIPPLNEQKRIVAIVNKSLASIMRG